MWEPCNHHISVCTHILSCESHIKNIAVTFVECSDNGLIISIREAAVAWGILYWILDSHVLDPRGGGGCHESEGTFDFLPGFSLYATQITLQ